MTVHEINYLQMPHNALKLQKGEVRTMAANKKQAESINAIMSRFYRFRNRILLKKYSELGLTVLQVTVLRAIYENNGCIQKELCTMVDTSPTVMVGILGTLERLGLVSRVYCAENRRITNTYITDKGADYVLRVQDIVADTENERLAELTAAERELLRTLLIKAMHSWQSFDAE